MKSSIEFTIYGVNEEPKHVTYGNSGKAKVLDIDAVIAALQMLISTGKSITAIEASVKEKGGFQYSVMATKKDAGFEVYLAANENQSAQRLKFISEKLSAAFDPSILH